MRVLVGVLLAGNLVFNPSFESDDGWRASGHRDVQQRLSFEPGRDGGRCARLDCTVFSGEGPSHHAMICQTGRISVRRGRWYRLGFWARGIGINHGWVEVALTNTRIWENAGLSETFYVSAQWQPFLFLFQATQDLPAENSRLQFWFKGTGTLWLDEVSLTEDPEGPQWFPQIGGEGVRNLVPNSSFEYGTANWGGFTYGLKSWAGNLYRLEGGEPDATTAKHGRYSLRLRQTRPVFWFDYYQPVCEPVRRLMVANHGWFRAASGETFTLSAWLKASTDDVPAELLVSMPGRRQLSRSVRVGRDWTRQEFTFKVPQRFFFIAIGTDADATLWIDAVQLERGAPATDYQPRQPAEAFLCAEAPANIFTNGAARVGVCGSGSGKLQVTDFFDRVILETRETSATIAQRGFFRARWISGSSTQQLRFAVVDPVRCDDSPLGFNHAYPWDFLVTLAQQAGVLWWRDWSAQWERIEPVQGQYDFSVPDAQIERVLNLGGRVLVLLPFPSAKWASSAPPQILNAKGYPDYRYGVAYPPRNEADFRRYVREVVRHYKPRGITHYQIFNESVFTTYSLPEKFGFGLADYLKWLAVAYQTIKEVDPKAVVVGGCSANPRSRYTTDFVKQGGLRFCDVFDLHMYSPPTSAEYYEEQFAALADLMSAHGGPKPVWITEWGCYADDDPPTIPWQAGDATMNRCRWPNERE
ncbi:MAG: beta-galactosidase, partial [Verrucomicrobiae bacterium]|nr:beta-galactosidase [Verrucomicrobiae bacterium]